MDKTVPKLDKFILSRASRRARLIHNADDSEGAEPERLTKTVSSRADAAKAAEEAYAMAVAVLGSFERDWSPDVSDAVANGESDVLAWHQRLLVAIEAADRTAAVEALAYLQWHWGRHFHDNHGWVRALSRHVQRIGDWLLDMYPSVQ